MAEATTPPLISSVPAGQKVGYQDDARRLHLGGLDAVRDQELAQAEAVRAKVRFSIVRSDARSLVSEWTILSKLNNNRFTGQYSLTYVQELNYPWYKISSLYCSAPTP